MVTGAVLAGGQSRRFGKNKALQVYRGSRLVDRAIESLRSICDPLLLIANDLSSFYDVRATLVQDIVIRQGPLTALYTALLFSPHDWVLIRATDMPFFTSELATMMLELRSGFDVVTPLYRHMYEPLLALYHRRCIPAVVAALESGEKKVVSFYSKVKVRTLEESLWRTVDSEGLSFLNINTPEDWERLQWS